MGRGEGRIRRTDRERNWSRLLRWRRINLRQTVHSNRQVTCRSREESKYQRNQRRPVAIAGRKIRCRPSRGFLKRWDGSQPHSTYQSGIRSIWNGTECLVAKAISLTTRTRPNGNVFGGFRKRHCSPRRRQDRSCSRRRVHLRPRRATSNHQLWATNTIYYVIADNPIGDAGYYPDSGKWKVNKSSAADRVVIKGQETDYFDGEE